MSVHDPLNPFRDPKAYSDWRATHSLNELLEAIPLLERHLNDPVLKVRLGHLMVLAKDYQRAEELLQNPTTPLQTGYWALLQIELFDRSRMLERLTGAMMIDDVITENPSRHDIEGQMLLDLARGMAARMQGSDPIPHFRAVRYGATMLGIRHTLDIVSFEMAEYRLKLNRDMGEEDLKELARLATTASGKLRDVAYRQLRTACLRQINMPVTIPTEVLSALGEDLPTIEQYWKLHHLNHTEMQTLDEQVTGKTDFLNHLLDQVRFYLCAYSHHQEGYFQKASTVLRKMLAMPCPADLDTMEAAVWHNYRAAAAVLLKDRHTLRETCHWLAEHSEYLTNVQRLFFYAAIIAYAGMTGNWLRDGRYTLGEIYGLLKSLPEPLRTRCSQSIQRTMPAVMLALAEAEYPVSVNLTALIKPGGIYLGGTMKISGFERAAVLERLANGEKLLGGDRKTFQRARDALAEHGYPALAWHEDVQQIIGVLRKTLPLRPSE